MQPLISIILPVYNVEKYIAICLNSVINQTYKNLEIIVVDDHSPDNSKEIILGYQQKDSRIKYIKNKANQGLFQSRKNGFLQSTGEFVVNLDPDDSFCSLTILEDAMTYFNSPSTDIVAFGWNVAHESKDEKQWDRVHQLPEKKLSTINEKLDEYFKMTSITESMWAKVFKRDVLISLYQDIPESHVVFQEDALCALTIFLYSNDIQLTSKIGNTYTQRGNSLTQFHHMSKDKVIKTLQDWIYVVDISIKILKGNQLWERYCNEFYNRHFRFYKWMYDPLKSRLTEQEYQEYEFLFIEAFLPWIFNSDTAEIVNDKWYKFGQLSRKQKIKKIISILLKKIKIK